MLLKCCRTTYRRRANSVEEGTSLIILVCLSSLTMGKGGLGLGLGHGYIGVSEALTGRFKQILAGELAASKKLCLSVVRLDRDRSSYIKT